MRKIVNAIVCFVFVFILTIQLIGFLPAMAATDTVSFGYSSGHGWVKSGVKTSGSSTASTLNCTGLVTTQTGSSLASNYFMTSLALLYPSGSYSTSASNHVRTYLNEPVFCKNADSGVGSTVRFRFQAVTNDYYKAYVTYTYN